jgi:hypothetical protein
MSSLCTRLLAGFVGLALAGCLNVTPPGVSFASEPSGAQVWVDGRDSGWVTPCQLALDLEESHVIRLSLSGYAPREMLLVPAERTHIAHWRQGVNGVKSTTRFPLLLPAVDFVFPLHKNQNLSPGRVYLRLRPVAGSPAP